MSVVGILAVLLGLVVVVFAIYAALTVWAPRVPNDLSELSDVDAWLENLVRSRAATAVSVAVVRDGDILWESAAGDADPFAGREATTQTVYHVWSVTKVATALAVLDIAEEGLLDLDAEVQKVLPWFEVEGDRDREITVRDLLQHTSALKDTVPAVFGWLRYDEALPNQTTFLREHLPDYRELRFRPGEERRYSNLGYMVLGAVLEAVAGQEYAAVVRERVLWPAGMIASDFVFNRDLVAHEALGSHPIGSIFTPLLLFLVDMPDLVEERTGKLLWLDRLYVEATPPTGLISSARNAAYLAHAAMTVDVVVGQDLIDLMLSPDEPPLGWNERGGGERRWLQHRGRGPECDDVAAEVVNVTRNDRIAVGGGRTAYETGPASGTGPIYRRQNRLTLGKGSTKVSPRRPRRGLSKNAAAVARQLAQRPALRALGIERRAVRGELLAKGGDHRLQCGDVLGERGGGLGSGHAPSILRRSPLRPSPPSATR